MRNHQPQLFALLAATAAISLSSCNSANSRSSTNPPSVVASEQVTMNHGGMTQNMDIGPADANYDLRFIDSMIPHHQGAVTMAQDLLQKSQRLELKKLAQNIITSQQQEIDTLKQWRNKWYPAK